MAIEFQAVSESGEIVTFFLTGTAEGNRVLQKAEIEALISAGGGTDELVKLSATDAVAQYLENKIHAGSNISIVETVDPAGDYITIATAGQSIPVGTKVNQLLQWAGGAWVTSEFLKLIEIDVEPTEKALWLDRDSNGIKFNDGSNSGHMANDIGSPNGIQRFWSGTQAQYDALTPDGNTIYFIE